MIRINLLSGQKKGRRASGSAGMGGGGGGGGSQVYLLAGVIATVVLGAVVFFTLHLPLKHEIGEWNKKNDELTKANKKLDDATKDFKTLKDAFEGAQARADQIKALGEARSVPSWLLWEVANILTRGRQPQLTEEAKEELKSNPNRPWQEGWDAKHVWLIDFTESNGGFTLDGGAQSDSDATQLALRMQSSMFFDNVSPKGGGEEIDKDSGLTYYKFTITGTVRY